MKLFVALILAIAPLSNAFGFAELVRDGYVNCTSCHVSPNGGGNLTAYGRELSRELLSTWGRQNPTEAQFAYGAVKPPEWLTPMGMYRSVVVHQRDPEFHRNRYVFMQGDGEAAITIQKQFIIDATAGYEKKLGDTSAADHFISRRHYVNYRPSDTLSFRFGRFFPQTGIYTPEHVIATRRSLGWDEGQETYNFEGAYIGDAINIFATAILGRFDKPSLHRETGFALSPSIGIADQHKIGVSYYYGDGLNTTRHVGGPYAILGLSRRAFILAEFDVQSQSQKAGNSPARRGYFDYLKADYEFFQGMHLYLTQDLAKFDSSNSRSLTNSYGLGLQFFPRPHLELNLSWQKARNLALAQTYSDFAWFMFNFYL